MTGSKLKSNKKVILAIAIAAIVVLAYLYSVQPRNSTKPNFFDDGFIIAVISEHGHSGVIWIKYIENDGMGYQITLIRGNETTEPDLNNLIFNTTVEIEDEYIHYDNSIQSQYNISKIMEIFNKTDFLNREWKDHHGSYGYCVSDMKSVQFNSSEIQELDLQIENMGFDSLYQKYSVIDLMIPGGSSFNLIIVPQHEKAISVLLDQNYPDIPQEINDFKHYIQLMFVNN